MILGMVKLYNFKKSKKEISMLDVTLASCIKKTIETIKKSTENSDSVVLKK